MGADRVTHRETGAVIRDRSNTVLANAALQLRHIFCAGQAKFLGAIVCIDLARRVEVLRFFF